MTNETKHTPGLWFWSDAYRTTYNEPTLSLIGADGYGILSCDGMANSPGEADAQLIAQSPELLEALEHATTVLCDHTCGTPGIFPADKDCVLCENIKRYKQIIARAKGGDEHEI